MKDKNKRMFELGMFQTEMQKEFEHRGGKGEITYKLYEDKGFIMLIVIFPAPSDIELFTSFEAAKIKPRVVASFMMDAYEKRSVKFMKHGGS